MFTMAEAKVWRTLSVFTTLVLCTCAFQLSPTGIRNGGGLLKKAGVDALFGRVQNRERVLRSTLQRPTGSEVESSAPTSSPNGQEWAYDWRKHWYPVGFAKDFAPGTKPYPVSIFDEPLVLYRDGENALQCVQDLCPHRASKLSEGMVTNGNIECLYHGWQFSGKDGTCVHVPQLPDEVSPPKAACLRVYPVEIREGVVFVWMGEDPWGEGAKDIKPVPCTSQNLDENKPDFMYQFVCDLPYDWSYLCENLVDPAHIQVSHHATSGGGNRKNAKPLSFEVDERSVGPNGFSAEVTTHTGKKSIQSFEAPCIIRITNEIPKEGEQEEGKGAVFGAALHTIPLGKGRSRLLFMTFGRRVPLLIKALVAIKPMFLRHMNSCQVLEQDIGLICTQEDHVARTGQSLSKAFLPIKSSDGLVVELRKWLDKVGHGMPFYQGWETSKDSIALTPHEHPLNVGYRAKESRFNRHVVLCETTRKALVATVRTKRAGFTVAAALSLVAHLAPAISAAAGGATFPLTRALSATGAVVALGVGAGATLLEGHFYKNYERHPTLV